MTTQRRLKLTVSVAILVVGSLFGITTALLGVQPAQASLTPGVPVLGLDCASGTVEPVSDGSHDSLCTWAGDVDAAPDGDNDPLISDPAPGSPGANGGGVWVTVLAKDLPSGVNGYDISLSYDRRYVDAFATDRSGTDFLGAPNNPFVLVDSIDHTTGTIRVAVVLLGTASGPGTYILFRVKFDIVGVGMSPIVITSHTITNPRDVAHKV